MAPERLVFGDECGLTTRLLRLFARAEGGQRAYDQVPYGNWQTFTAFGAVRLGARTAVMTLEGACDTDSFLAYVERVLAPSLSPGDVVVLDNLAPHKHPQVQALVAARGARVVHLPPYSPDFNPIENMWSKVKAYVRKHRPRDEATLLQRLQEGLEGVTAKDVLGWFRHCGYGAIQS